MCLCVQMCLCACVQLCECVRVFVYTGDVKGESVSLSSLRKCYDAVVLATGAHERPRTLVGVKGRCVCKCL